MLLDARAAATKAERTAVRAATALQEAQLAETQASEAASLAAAAAKAADERRRQLEGSQAARDLEALELLKTQSEQAASFASELSRQSESAAAQLAAAGQAIAAGEQELVRRIAALTRAVDSAELIRLGLAAPAELSIDDRPGHQVALEDLARAVGSAAAVVAVCLQALAAVEVALAQQATSEELAAAAASAAESAAVLAATAEQQAIQSETSLEQAIQGWIGSVPSSAAEAFAEPNVPDAVDLNRWRDELVAPVAAALAAGAGGLDREVEGLDRELMGLSDERVQVEAEQDPAPPLPALMRSPRETVPGLPLWRVVDVRTQVSERDRAGLEAALQSSGLLDALVLADGRVLQGDDVVLTAGPAVTGSLEDLLVPAVPLGSPVDEATVRRVHESVATAPMGSSEACAAVDGTWRLGVASGRASKAQAQYLGATARAAERLRLLAELTARITAVEESRVSRIEERERLQAEQAAVRDWAAELPDPRPVLTARTVAHERLRAAQESAAGAAAAERKAGESRARTAAARRELTGRTTEAGLPDDRAALSSRGDRLREAATSVRTALSGLVELEAARERGLRDRAEADRLEAAADLATAAARTAISDAERAAAAYDARRESLSATQQELARALAEAAEEQAESSRAHEAAIEARVQAGKALAHAEDARERTELARQDADHGRRGADRAGASLHSAPGLVAAALASQDVDPDDWEALRSAVKDIPVADRNALLGAHRDLATGPAAHLQIRLETTGDDLYVVTGRDDEGQAPLVTLASRLSARVEHDRTLLTAQQREVCEKHLLGELGEVLRKRRLDAARLVAHMNALLEGVRTSQGIRARLDWKLRDDAPDEVRGTVVLLERPLGSLLPAQREQLLELLSSLIESARRDDPDAGYAEHLRTALDYRTWNDFAVLIRRPGNDNEERLSRRTALSQGEQKVVCYLPLFAAAAAHFTSLAVEAPLAPRFVLLDDAFPKIDVRTHPVLFGLLVDLELDWVVTSERLWGDYPTVPAVAVYEVLRSAQERGVLPYKHLWDGRELRAVGA